jgi:hypothetical protein
MKVIVTNNLDTMISLADLGGYTITVSGVVDLRDSFSPHELAASDDLVQNIASAALTVNNGSADLTPGDAVKYVALSKHVNPVSPDGKEMIRSDSRPAGTQTVFTMCGDSETGILDGKVMKWDFSNDDDLFYGPAVPSGMKCKRISIFFNDPVYLKDGTLYFFDAPWGSYLEMCIAVPAGNYYPNSAGTIPDYMLGLPNTGTMYSYAADDVPYAHYVTKHHIYGSCPMGDELNAEGCQLDPIPVGWHVNGYIYTWDDDTTSKGFGCFEMYRARTTLLPGEEV